jgi:hypothetical protein
MLGIVPERRIKVKTGNGGPPDAGKLPLEILNDIDLENYKPELIGTESIGLERGVTAVDPKEYGKGAEPDPEELEALSKIIED